mgnify:CR=1 FL=1
MNFNLQYTLADTRFEEVHHGESYLAGMMEIARRLDDLDAQGLYPLENIVITVEVA